MLPDVNRTSKRRYLVFGAYTAQTPEQIRLLRASVDNWLHSHPEDAIVQRAARRLERSEDRLRQAGQWPTKA